ncbi:MAG: type I methionyl aminopeptidase [bacterium]|nr:type I methionyl aminopeptidase [bacterium]
MIILKSKQEIEKIRNAGKIVKEVGRHLEQIAKPGITTKYLEETAHEMIIKRRAKPAFLGYHGFPGSICTSINAEVVHGIPSAQRILKYGDILKVDVAVLLDGYCADAALTIPIGQISAKIEKLVAVTKKALEIGIAKAKPPNRLFDISHAIQFHAQCYGYSVVRDYTGHGIGREMHEAPQVPNFGEAGKGPRLKPGMVLCIEPMINMGGYEIDILNDGWTVITKDKSFSAHFEHTIVITDGEPEILTK